MNILKRLFYEVFLANNTNIAFTSCQIPGILSSIPTQDVWQKDLDDSLNIRFGQYIWESVYEASLETKLQQFFP